MKITEPSKRCTRRIRVGFVVAAACVVGSLAAVGCDSAGAQFSGHFYYGNLIGSARADELRAEAFDQLVARARSVGLEPTQRVESRIIFRTQAPNWVSRGPDGEAVTRIDPRVLTVEVRSGQGASRHSYRYLAGLSGPEPAGFTAQARAQLGLALLAAREVFEAPLATHFFPYAAPPAQPEPAEPGATPPAAGQPVEPGATPDVNAADQTDPNRSP